MKNWQNATQGWIGGELLASLTLISLRCLLAVPVYALFSIKLFTAPSRSEHLTGFMIGTVNFAAFTLQVLGLGSTSPALSAFFTSLGSAWVPILAFVVFRAVVRGATLAGLLLGLVGAAIMSIDLNERWLLGRGEWLTLAASVLFAIEVLMIDRLGKTVRPGHMSIGFLVGTGLPALLLASCLAVGDVGFSEWLAWTNAKLQSPALLRDVILVTLLSTVAASYFFTTYQPRVSAGRAALIYLLEPVFAAILSVMMGLDQISNRLVGGGALILLGNVLVDLPLWWRELTKARQMENDPPH